jgi:tetratricopeptide (TPR) repeat protein
VSFDLDREIDKLIASANLHRMRGQLLEAEEDCRKALSMSPNDVVVRELLGDILYEAGKLDSARNEYKIAMELSPGKASVETKYAKVILEIAEREREKAIARDMIENPQKYLRQKRNPSLAAISAIIPGLGQFYNGDLIKALIIWGVMLLFFASWALPHHYPEGIRTVQDFIYYTNPIVLVLGILFVMVYFYGLIDAAVTAEKRSKSERNVDGKAPG